MSEITRKVLLTGDKFMPEMHLRKPGFTSNAWKNFFFSFINTNVI